MKYSQYLFFSTIAALFITSVVSVDEDGSSAGPSSLSTDEKQGWLPEEFDDFADLLGTRNHDDELLEKYQRQQPRSRILKRKKKKKKNDKTGIEDLFEKVKKKKKVKKPKIPKADKRKKVKKPKKIKKKGKKKGKKKKKDEDDEPSGGGGTSLGDILDDVRSTFDDIGETIITTFFDEDSPLREVVDDILEVISDLADGDDPALDDCRRRKLIGLVDELKHRRLRGRRSERIRELQAATRASHSMSPVEGLSSGAKVVVWDEVLASPIREQLHEVAKEVGLGHVAFERNMQHPDEKSPVSIQTNPIESVLNSILTELGDDSTYVEYWTRQEWRSIEAHADVDEFLAKEQDKDGEEDNTNYRYPTNGHVLYLQVGSSVRGPTCVFPDRRSGGDLLLENTILDSGSSSDKGMSTTINGQVELVTVPAVEGRLLRFQGDFLHAVPRPTDLWLLPFVQGAATFEPEEKWGRSVILFNTWNSSPPMGIPITTSSVEVSTEQIVNSHEEGGFSCTDISSWTEVFRVDDKLDDTTCQDSRSEGILKKAKIWLLGNLRRRGHPMRTIPLFAPPDTLRTALEDPLHPRRVQLFQSNE